MSIRAGGDDGKPAVLSGNADAYADVFKTIAQQLAARVSVLEHV
jgi:ATP-binding protein involved in chromosome partitioning